MYSYKTTQKLTYVLNQCFNTSPVARYEFNYYIMLSAFTICLEIVSLKCLGKHVRCTNVHMIYKYGEEKCKKIHGTCNKQKFEAKFFFLNYRDSIQFYYRNINSII